MNKDNAIKDNASIIFENVTLAYNRHPAIHHLSGHFAPFELTAIVGMNGSGKSTLLKGIMGQIPTLEGKIHVPFKAPQIAYLPQRDDLDRDFPITIEDFVSSGLMLRQGAWCCYKCDKLHVQEAIKTVGLEGFEKRLINTLSGGQWQRARFARIIVQNASLILLDEPFNALDEKTSSDLLAVLKSWKQQQKTILIVLHDMDLVKKHFNQTLLLARNKIAWGNTKDTLTPQNLTKARVLYEAFKEGAPLCDLHDEEHKHVH